jgi:alpha-beta hydrolase superfamily lysophospholipase
MATEAGSQAVVLIHGLWLNALSWEHWAERYSAAGANVIAKSWPGMDAEPAALRADSAAFKKLGFEEVTSHYEQVIRGLDSPPILMGHSMGGVIVQLLLDRGLGAAGVAIDPGPTKGVLNLPLSTLKSSSPALRNPLNRGRAVMLTSKQFHYAFTNTMSDAESDAAYERYAVPGPGKLLFQAALANFNPRAATRINYRNPTRAPLLLIAGGSDHVAPPVTTRVEAKLQQKSPGVTAYKEFPGRPHFTCGAPGWEEVADFALDWARNPKPIPIS